MVDQTRYIEQMKRRVLKDLAAIQGRPDPVFPGRTVPSSGAMARGTGRRLEASVLFLDISGFSKRPSETIDEQATMLHAITLMFSEFIRIIEDHGGTVEKNTGDGLMAYFVRDAGKELSHQCRALISSMYMFRAAESAIDPIFNMHGVEPFRFRIAIDAGHITVAQVGAKRGFTGIVAIGSTANVASKMLGRANAGDILLGANHAAALPDVWRPLIEFREWSTQFVYKNTTNPYPYFAYTGRY